MGVYDVQGIQILHHSLPGGREINGPALLSQFLLAVFPNSHSSDQMICNYLLYECISVKHRGWQKRFFPSVWGLHFCFASVFLQGSSVLPLCFDFSLCLWVFFDSGCLSVLRCFSNETIVMWMFAGEAFLKYGLHTASVKPNSARESPARCRVKLPIPLVLFSGKVSQPEAECEG